MLLQDLQETEGISEILITNESSLWFSVRFPSQNLTFGTDLQEVKHIRSQLLALPGAVSSREEVAIRSALHLVLQGSCARKGSLMQWTVPKGDHCPGASI